MKKGSTPHTSGIGRTLLGALALFALVAFSSGVAEAALIGQAGNAIIRNTVTVNYSDALGGNPTQTSDSIDLTINTIDSTPIVMAFSPASGSTIAEDDTQNYTVTFVTTSNGPGTVTWSGADNNPSNIAVSGTTPSFASGSEFLGATILDPTDANIGNSTTLTASGSAVAFTVPNDGGVPTDAATSGGGTGDNVLNGIAVGDVVFLYDGTDTYGPFDVTAVSDPAVGAGTTAAPGSISLQNNTGADITVTPALGWAIVETKDDTLTVSQGVITDATQAASWDTTVTADMAGKTGNNTVTTTAAQGVLSVVKYVRNVDTANGTGTSISFNSQTYYDSGVNGNPGETLEYLIVVTNDGAADATDVVVTDSIPTYTKYVAGSLKVDQDGDETTDVTISAGSETAGADAGSGILTTDTGTDNDTVGSFTVYAGTAGDDTSGSESGGTIAGTKTSAVIFQVTID